MPTDKTPEFQFGYLLAHEYRISDHDDREFARRMLIPAAQAGWDAYFAKRAKGCRYA